MMPELDGLELCKRLRRDPSLDSTKIVIVSGKPYEFDQKRALDFGADAYFIKPIDAKTIVDQILLIIQDKIQLRYWGIRGTLPVPGEATVRYGGNTSCVSVEFPKGELFIFDAGTGIQNLGQQIVAQKKPSAIHLFFSHFHWDHVQGIGYFIPIFIPSTHLHFYSPWTVKRLKHQLNCYFDYSFGPFPSIDVLSSQIYYHSLNGAVSINGFEINYFANSHEGNCYGYSIARHEKKVAIITDADVNISAFVCIESDISISLLNSLPCLFSYLMTNIFTAVVTSITIRLPANTQKPAGSFSQTR